MVLTSKLLGEVSGRNSLTIRTSLVGSQLSEQTGLLEWFLSEEGKSIKGYKCALFSGLTTRALCAVIERILVEYPLLCGIRHIASLPISKFDLLERLKSLMALNVTIQPDEEFYCNRTLDGSRFLHETGIAVPSWNEMLEEFIGDRPHYVTGPNIPVKGSPAA
jgi:dTDP-4-dehydrorhamnose reductase